MLGNWHVPFGVGEMLEITSREYQSLKGTFVKMSLLSQCGALVEQSAAFTWQFFLVE